MKFHIFWAGLAKPKIFRAGLGSPWATFEEPWPWVSKTLNGKSKGDWNLEQVRNYLKVKAGTWKKGKFVRKKAAVSDDESSSEEESSDDEDDSSS